MKVLNIIQRYPPAIGGAETWCSNISQFLANKGLIIKVATINLYNIEEFYKDSLLDQQYVRLGRCDFDNGVFVTRYNLWSFYSGRLSSKILNLFFHELQLDKTEIGNIFKHSPHSFEMYSKLLYEAKDADIVHLHSLPYFHNIVGYFIAKILGKKIVITPHFHPEHPQHERNIFFWVLNKTDAIITMTKYEKEYLVKKGIRPEKIYVTGNFAIGTNCQKQEEPDGFIINLVKRYGINKEAKKIIFIGRKELYKGIGILIEAAKSIADEEGMDLFLFLVGPDTTEFVTKYPDLNNMGRLKVINFGLVSEEEKSELLKLSDLLVLPSEFEAFGIVFLEAWQYKKPVIGSNRGGVPEVIENAGLCTEYGDIKDLKGKIKTILFDKELALKLGEAGKEKLKEYSLEKIGSKVFNIYCAIRKRNKILIVSHLFHPYFIGGSEIVAYEQAKMLKNLGFDIKIFAGRINNKGKGYLVNKEKGKFEIMRFNLHEKDFDYNFVDFDKKELLGGFRKALFEIAPDIVHFHNIYPLSIKMIVECCKIHIPTIMTLHDFWGICFKNLLITNEGSLCYKKGIECIYCQRDLRNADGNPVSLAERNRTLMQYLNMVDLLISPSRYLISRFIDCGIPKDKTVIINYGIDLSRFKKIEKARSNKIRFGYIGQIIRHKGVENLLRAVSLLSEKEKKRMSLLLVGSGEKSFVKYCKSLTKELMLSDIVTFYGEVENNKVPKLYRNIDILIVPSIWPENSPVTIMESLATGTPVLASNIGGIPELIQDGINGFLHKHDEPISLATNIKRIIEHPKIINKMKQACLLKAEEHDLLKPIKKIAEHYIHLATNN